MNLGDLAPEIAPLAQILEIQAGGRVCNKVTGRANILLDQSSWLE
jgi:hypothetical protein